MNLSGSMAGIRHVVFLVVLTFLWTPARGDAEVSCVFMESCILPCSFQGGADVVIHWTLLNARQTSVHSYYDSQDQLRDQDQHFRGRTSLFEEQISRGNASLRLTGVKLQDRVTYRCFTSTMHGKNTSLINLKVDAPVDEVSIVQLENRVTCRAEGIYPEPNLTWSTYPPSSVTFKSTTIIQQSKQQLYTISSSLIASDNVADLTYSCTVSTHKYRKTATLLNQVKPSMAIGGVVGVILVAVLMSLVPCCYFKCKKSRQVPVPLSDLSSYQPDVSCTEEKTLTEHECTHNSTEQL